MSDIEMVLWVHSHADNNNIPCGEIDVASISGEKIPFEFINWINDEKNHADIIDCMKIVPPLDEWLLVVAEYSVDEFEWGVDIKSWTTESTPTTSRD